DLIVTGVQTCALPISVHKGFGLVGGNNRPYASPVDVGPAAKANPDVKFVVYHSGYEPEDQEGPYTDATADVGVNRLIKTAMGNEIGRASCRERGEDAG